MLRKALGVFGCLLAAGSVPWSFCWRVFFSHCGVSFLLAFVSLLTFGAGMWLAGWGFKWSRHLHASRRATRR